jgi:xylulokinase
VRDEQDEPNVARGDQACALGIDVGLSGVRAAILSEDGRILGRARRPVASSFGPGRAEANPRALLSAVHACAREALAGVAERVVAIGVGALGPAPLLVDERFEPLTPALLFSLDTRAEEQRARLGVSQDHALPKLLWWRDHEPDLWTRAAWALDVTGFLVSRLTGTPTMDEITRVNYSAPGHEPPIPQPLDPLAIAGGLRATELGAPTGTPVAAGTYDTYVDVAAIGVRSPGDAGLLLGSTLVVCRAVAEPVECAGLELTPYPGDGLLLGGWTAAGGSVLAWWERELGARPSVDELEPGDSGLVALPYFAGERTPVSDPHARGLVLGLTLATTRAQVYRALVDALALAALDHAARLAAVGLGSDIWLAGGGGTQNRAWLRATCDALGAPLAVAPFAGDAVGPACLALRAVGVEPRLPPAELIHPDACNHDRYQELYAVYRGLHPTLAEAMRRLGALA